MFVVYEQLVRRPAVELCTAHPESDSPCTPIEGECVS